MAQILTLAAYRSDESQQKQKSRNDGASATILIFDGVWQEAIKQPAEEAAQGPKRAIAAIK